MRIRPGRVAAPIIAVTAALGFAFAPAPELRSQEDEEAPRVVTEEPGARIPLAAPSPIPDPAPAPAVGAPAPRIVAVTRPEPGGPVVDPGAAAADPTMPPPAGAPSTDSGETLTVFLDHAKVIRLPERTQTVIVGNPFIADVTVQRNGILIVTGKSYGATNLIALDGQGLLLAESMVSVQAPDSDGVVVVQRGLARESYACTPHCQPSLRLGDSADYFGAVGNQANQRAGFAVSN